MVIYQTTEVVEQIYSFRTLIYYEKAMVLWKNYGTVKKTIYILYRKRWNFDLL